MNRLAPRPWALVAVLGAAMGLGAAPQFTVGAVAPFLIEEFDLTKAGIGIVVSGYLVVASTMSPAAGRFIDVIGAERGLRWSLALAFLSYVGIGLAPAEHVLVVAVMVGGLAAAGVTPATNRMIVDHVPEGRRGWAIGWKQSGVPLAVFVVGAVVPATASAAGWRWAAGVLAALAVVVVLASARVVPTRRPATSAVAGRRAPSISIPPLGWLKGYTFLMAGGTAVANTYYVLFAADRLGFPAATAALVGSVVGAVGVAARVLWAHVADSSSRSGLLVVVAVIGVAATVLVVSSPAVGSWLIWPAAVLAGMSVASWNAVVPLMVLRLVPAPAVGAASGGIARVMFAGLLSTPIVFGLSVDVADSYAYGLVGQGCLFAAAAVLAHVN